jgi:hypothetical protein
MVYIRTKENQEKHDATVGNWAKRVIEAGWRDVWSDLPGNVKPPVVAGFIPDIYAVHNGEKYIIEIETTDSVNSPHAMQQKIAFRAWENASFGRKFEVKIA